MMNFTLNRTINDMTCHGMCKSLERKPLVVHILADIDAANDRIYIINVYADVTRMAWLGTTKIYK